MANSTQDERIRSSWAYNCALQYMQAAGEQLGKDMESNLKAIDMLAEQFYPRVDTLIAKMQEQGVAVESVPASDKSIKYLKSLIMQNASGWVKGQGEGGPRGTAGVDEVVEANFGKEPTQADVSEAIEYIKENGNLNNIDFMGDRRTTDYEGIDPREEPENREELK